MGRSFDVESVLAGKPDTATLLRRGATKRCPRCGSGGLYRGWFQMVDRCPACGYRFEREPGFFIGAYFVNFAIAEGFLFILLMVFVFWKNTRPDTGVTVPIVIGVAGSVVLPIVFYPFSRTIWSAIDLAMTPLEMDEIVAAADAVSDEAEHVDPPGQSGQAQRPDQGAARPEPDEPSGTS